MNLDLAQTHSDLADAYLREGDADKVMEHLNEAFSIYDKMLPENARQLLQPYSTLANLLLALNEYDESIMADSEINVLDKYIEKEALHAMMAVLTKKQRNLIYQNYVLDKTHQEIADGMGIARGSVTRSVNQALERIRRKFDFEAHYELAIGDFT